MPEIVGCAKVEKVWESKLRENFAAITGGHEPGASIESLVRDLERFFEKNTPEGRFVECDQCLGWSDEAACDACPYCGDVGDDEAISVVPVVAPEQLALVDSDPDLETTVIDATAIVAEGIDLEGNGKPERKKKGKVSPPPSMPSRPASAPSLVLAGGRALTSEQELDDALAAFRRMTSQGNGSYYLAGLELVKIRNTLWQQRTVDGKPKYKSWDHFAREEFDRSKTYVFRLIRVCEQFSRDVFERYGIKSLMLFVGAPKEDHPALMAMADAGASTREIGQEVARLRDSKGITVAETTATIRAAQEGKALPAALGAEANVAAAAARKKEAAAITVGLRAESANVDLFTRPKKGEEARPARTLEDQPYGVLDCMNGVRIYFALKQKATGELYAKVTAKRDDE